MVRAIKLPVFFFQVAGVFFDPCKHPVKRQCQPADFAIRGDFKIQIKALFTDLFGRRGHFIQVDQRPVMSRHHRNVGRNGQPL